MKDNHKYSSGEANASLSHADFSASNSSESVLQRYLNKCGVISFLTSPDITIALISLSYYLLWMFPLKPLWAAMPSILAFVFIVLLPIISSNGRATCQEMYSQFPESSISFPCSVSWFSAVICFIASPVFLALMAVFDPLPCISIALLACLIAYLAFKHIKARKSEFHQSSRVLTGMIFILLLVFVSYAICLSWQYFTSRGLALPFFFANSFASMERTVNAVPFLSALSFSDAGTGCVFTTRGDIPAIVTGPSTSKTFLLFDEHLHFLLLSLLLFGSLIVTLCLKQKGRFISSIFDAVSIFFVLLIYLMATWRDILWGQLGSVLWPNRFLGAISIVFLWLSIRFLFGDIINGAKYTSSQIMTLCFPKSISKASLLILTIFLFGFLWLLHDPGVVKNGRVIVDEYHSEWEKADLPMETDHFGVKTVYNYGFLKEILKKHFSLVTTNHHALTEQILNDCDVLILKTPTKPYSEEEIRLIHSFVRNGGGLWLIGDHTNIFGMNAYLNQIACKWNVRLNSDAVSPLPHYYQQMVHKDGLSPYAECGKRSHENIYSRKYLNHPIIGHNIPYVTVLTSCSVSAPLRVEHINIAKGMYIDHAHYGSNTFFGNLAHDQDERYGHVLQNVALADGYGRVAVWSDSTLFSNFSMCMSGVPSLAIGYVSWLNRSNCIPAGYRQYVFLTLGVVAIVIVLFMRQKPSQIVISACAGILLVAVFIPVIDFINTASYAFDDYRKGFNTVGFDQEYSNTKLPNKDHVHNEDVDVFEGFYVFMQRMQLMPFSADKFVDIAKSDVVVVINPRKQFNNKDIFSIQNEITKNGKTLIIMAGENYRHAEMQRIVDNANTLLSKLDVSDRFVARDTTIQIDMFGPIVAPNILVDVPSSTYIDSDGTDEQSILLTNAESEVLVKTTELGNGKIILCSIPELYTNRILGGTGVRPTHKQSVLFQSIISIFNHAIQLDYDNKNATAAWEELLTPAPSSPLPVE